MCYIMATVAEIRKIVKEEIKAAAMTDLKAIIAAEVKSALKLESIVRANEAAIANKSAQALLAGETSPSISQDVSLGPTARKEVSNYVNKTMAREVSAAIRKEVFPVLRDIGRYLKVTLIDGEEEINNYRREVVGGGLSQEDKDNGSAHDTITDARPSMKSEMFGRDAADDNYSAIAAQVSSATTRPTVTKYGSIKNIMNGPADGSSKKAVSKDDIRSIFY
jgi:hypothetical protein